MDAFDIVFIDKLSYLIGRFLGNLGFEPFISLADILCLFFDPFRLQLQNICQILGDQLYIRFGLPQFVGIQVHGLHSFR